MIHNIIVLCLGLVLICFNPAWSGQTLPSTQNSAPHSPASLNVDKPDSDSNTPLMVAAKHGKIDVMKSLLARGADVHARNPRGATPLMFAVDGGVAAVELLLKKGARINDQRPDGMSALSWAVLNNHSDVFEHLLRAGADFRLFNDKRDTLLHLAAEKGSTAIAKRLLALGLALDALDSFSETPLIKAAEHGHPEVVKLLLAHKALLSHWSAEVETALSAAAKKGNLAVVRELVQAGAPVRGKEGDRAITNAVQKKHVEVVRFLLDKGADVNARGFSGRPLVSLASWVKQPELAIMLLKRGADANMNSEGEASPLEMAAMWTDSAELVKALLKSGARVEKTGLIMACGKQSPDMLAVLLAVGFDIGATENDSYKIYSCLHAAALRGSADTVAYILKQAKQKRTASGTTLEAVLLNAADSYKQTPLMEAVRRDDKGMAPVVKTLLDAGSPLEAINERGNTALHLAAEYNNAEAIRLLLAKGTHISTNSHKETPLEVAASAGKLDAVLALDKNPKTTIKRPWLAELIEKLAESDKGSAELTQALKHYGTLITPDVRSRALWQAVFKNNLESARILVENRADPNGIGGEWIALSESKTVPMAELLVKHKARIDHPDKRGHTTLQEVTKKENLPLVRWLLDHGADPNRRDERDWNTLDYARESGLREMIAAVEKGGGRSQRVSPVLWASEVTEKDENTIYGFKAAPLVAGDLLIVGHENGNIYALERKSGALRWKRNLAGEIHHEIRLLDGDLFVTTNNHTITRIKPRDGAVVWQFAYSGRQVACGAWGWNDLVLVADYEGTIWAVDRATGKLRWEKNIGKLNGVARGEDAVRLAGNGLYALDKDEKGLKRYDLVTGKTVSFSAKNTGMPEIAEGLVFLPSKDKLLYVLDAVTLKLKQKVKLDSEAMVRPLYYNGRLFVPTKDALVTFPMRSALMRKTGLGPLGSKSWQLELGDELYARPVVSNGRIVTFISQLPQKESKSVRSELAWMLKLVHLVTLAPKNGKILSKIPLEDSNFYGDRLVTPAVDNDVVYAMPLGTGRRVQALKVSK